MPALRTTGFALSLFALAAALAVADGERLTNEQKAEAYLARLAESGADAEVVARIQTAWKEAQEGGYADEFLGEALIHASPEYRAALDLYEQDQYAEAAEAFGKVAADSKDPYLQAGATYQAAICHVEREDFEKARPLFERVGGELSAYSQWEAESVFWLAHCHAFLLDRDQAIETLTRFLTEYTDAKERFRITAAQFKDQLAYRGENELLDLSDRMTFVKRLLDRSRTDDPTQEKQKEIIEILDKLIKKHEDDCPT